MNKLFKYMLLTALTLICLSCGEDFLDDPALNGTESLTSAQFEEAAAVDPEVTGALMAGVYSLTFTAGTGGTTGHDDFGQKAYDVYGDMLSGDLALSQSVYGWYRSNITEFQATIDFTNGDNRQVWRYYYRIIRGCNEVIDGLGGTAAIPENDENKAIMGQAKALRAHSYFYLTQFFQKEYSASEEILPIYISAIDPNGPKVTAMEIYDLMESDLSDAISLLGNFNRSNKTQIDQYIAKAIYSYVLGARGEDYAKAYDMAVSAIAGGYTLMSASEITGGFNDVTTPGWMWGVDLNDEIGLGLISWWGQVDYYSYSYAAFGDFKAIDQSLFDAIPANDARKDQFLNRADLGQHLLPLFKFYDADRVRYGSGRIIKADYVYMRVAEMHLLAAEYAAASNNDASAKTYLKNVVSQRIANTSYIDGLSGQALKNEIYLQTRIELFGEGKSYLAMKRNKVSITRGSNHLSSVGEAIPYNDEKLTFEIPEGEIQFNPFINSQNN